MNRTIKSDLFRYTGRPYRGRDLIRNLKLPGFRFTFLLRLYTSSKSHPFRRILLRICLRHYSYKYGFQIAPGSEIGEGFYIGHFGNIVIHENTVIGKNCNITHGVTIGQSNRGKFAGVPVIGNKVWLGTNCVLVGKIRIGSNVLVAPGAFVNFDVPDDSIVLGNPGKIIHRKDATLNYINRIWE